MDEVPQESQYVELSEFLLDEGQITQSGLRRYQLPQVYNLVLSLLSTQDD